MARASVILAVAMGLLLSFNGSVTSAQAQGAVSSFMIHGDGGQAVWFDGPVIGFVFVNRGGSIQDPTTLLNYSIFSCCPFVDHEAGVGFIPNTDLQGDAEGTLILNTDTSSAGNPTFSRSAGSGGPISIRWQKNGFMVLHTQGTSSHQIGSLLLKFNGTTASASATASGTIIGFQISGSVSAFLDKRHSVQLQIQQGP